MNGFSAHVEAIRWIDKEAREAEVAFQIGECVYHAYCHPCDFDVAGDYQLRIDCLEAELSTDAILQGNPMRDKRLERRTDGSWAYDAYGQITSLAPFVVDCGDVQLTLPKRFRDEQLIGQYAYIGIARLDVSRV